MDTQGSPPTYRRSVPWRTILAVVGVVLTTYVGLLLVRQLRNILLWILIAAFVALVLNPPVEMLVRRGHIRRGVATLTVFLLGIALFGAMLYMFIRPIVDQAEQFADNFPVFVEQAQNGKGAVGRLVQRYKLDDWLQRNRAQLQATAQKAGTFALRNASKAAGFLVELITILVLAFLMLLEGPEMLKGGLNALPPPRRDRITQVSRDCARAVTGYMFGNLVISVIAGLAVFVFLSLAGVPFQGVLALWVAFADLIPMVGATLGAVPTIGVAFLHSVPAGIAAIIFFVLYQQFENHVLQVSIMARTVKLNPLLVLVSVLVGVELLGFVGALLAIPAAGVIQVIVRDVYDHRQGRLKVEPTVGEEKIPISDARVAPGGPREAQPVGPDESGQAGVGRSPVGASEVGASEAAEVMDGR